MDCGGAWSRDGVILFGTARHRPVAGFRRRRPPLGGHQAGRSSGRRVFMPHPISFPMDVISSMTASGRSDKRASTSARSTQNRSNRVPSRSLVNGSSAPLMHPLPTRRLSSGYVLFSRETSLMAQAFDAGRLELTGEAVPIAEGVGSGGPRRFSASMTGVLAYRTGTDSGEFGERSRNSPGSIGKGNRWRPSESRAHTTLWLCRRMERASQ